MKIVLFAFAGLVIQRALRIKASPEKIFAFVNAFHKWPLWVLRDTEEPSMKRTYGGASSRTGAVSEWQGSSGKGRMEITDSSEPDKVTIRVDFEKPFKSRNINAIVLERQGDCTMATRNWNGTNVYMLKVMSVFFDRDAMMCKHFETGLNNLKALTEK